VLRLYTELTYVVAQESLSLLPPVSIPELNAPINAEARNHALVYPRWKSTIHGNWKRLLSNSSYRIAFFALWEKLWDFHQNFIFACTVFRLGIAYPCDMCMPTAHPFPPQKSRS